MSHLLSFRDTALKILRGSDQPLSAKDITSAALKDKLSPPPAKQGGNQFLGCPAFPGCRGMVSLVAGADTHRAG